MMGLMRGSLDCNVRVMLKERSPGRSEIVALLVSLTLDAIILGDVK